MSKLHEVMNDPDTLERMKELAETGASIAVIEAKLQLKPGIISTWLAKGDKPRTIYARFKLLFRSWAAESTYLAQQQLLAKNPNRWLEISSTAKVIEKVTPEPGLIVSNNNNVNRPQLTADALVAAMKVLIESKNVDENIIDAEFTNEKIN